MRKKLLEYVKFTNAELEGYIKKPDSDIVCINHELHMGVPPFALNDFKYMMYSLLCRNKVGFYESHLDGIVLDIKRIKVLDSLWPIRYNNPEFHLNIRADFYIFKPIIGSVIEGTVKHITKTHIAVVIYRVFNASIILDRKYNVEKDQVIQFKIESYDLKSKVPYIEGTLIDNEETVTPHKNKSTRTCFKFDSDDDMECDENVDSGFSGTGDVKGILKRDTKKYSKTKSSQPLLEKLKEESISSDSSSNNTNLVNKSKKKTRDSVYEIKIKEEPPSEQNSILEPSETKISSEKSKKKLKLK